MVIIIGSFNIRGLGSQIKKCKTRELKHHINFLSIHDVKLVEANRSMCHFF